MSDLIDRFLKGVPYPSIGPRDADALVEDIVLLFDPACFGGMLPVLDNWWSEAESRSLSDIDHYTFTLTVDGIDASFTIWAKDVFKFLTNLYQRLEEVHVGELDRGATI